MIYKFESGAYYDGDSEDGLFKGKGTFYFTNGDKYIGEFENDMFNGKGEYHYNTGDKYIGMFGEDNFHGIGTYYYKTGAVEKGKFFNGKRVGKFFQVEEDCYYAIVYNNDKIQICETIEKERINEEKLP